MKKHVLKTLFFLLLPLMAVGVISCDILTGKEKDNDDPGLSVAYEKYELDNGLNVVLHQDKSDPIVAVAIQYGVGSNPKLEMITGGTWELNIYPHLPHKYKPRDILFTYFIEFNDGIYQCEIIDIKGDLFTYIHRKTTPIKGDDDLVYSLEPSSNPYYNRSIYRPINTMQERVLWFFKHNKVFYQSNDIGDAVNNYLKICRGR